MIDERARRRFLLRSARRALPIFVVLFVLIAGFPLPGAARAAESLAARIDRFLAHENLRGAKIGVEIRSLDGGGLLYGRNVHEPLIVASNNKLITTASALFHLGAGFEFETRLYCRGTVRKGRLEGDLIVKGGGDPCLSGRFFGGDALGPMKVLAAGVRAAGIEAVTGDIVLDDTLFDREYVAPGWPADQLCYYYCAPVSGLSFNENVLDVTVRTASRPGLPARATLSPPCGVFSLEGRIVTGAPRSRSAIHIERPDSRGVLAVRGVAPLSKTPWKGKVAVLEPPLFFGAVLRAELEREGVSVAGRLVLAGGPVDCAGPRVRRLAVLRSSLEEAVRVTNKLSHNNMAEHLFKLAGWKVEGRGSFETGAAAARLFIEKAGKDAAGSGSPSRSGGVDPFTMVDGSGLSRRNRFSPHTIVSLLAAVYASPLRDAYVRSLPVAGEDGSLKKRLAEEPYRRRVRAKTGWIRGVSALSGYLQAKSGEVFAFSILFNGYKGLNKEMKKVQDGICRAVVDLE